MSESTKKEPQEISALEKLTRENAELKRQLEERRINLTTNTCNHCKGVDPYSLKVMVQSNNLTRAEENFNYCQGNHTHYSKLRKPSTAKSYQELCHEHICRCADAGIDPLIGFPVPIDWELEEVD